MGGRIELIDKGNKMQTYYKQTLIIPGDDLSEKEVFLRIVKEIRDWEPTEEVDFMISSGCFVTKFSSLKYKELGGTSELRNDTMRLSVKEFYEKYESELKGKWNNNKKVIL